MRVRRPSPSGLIAVLMLVFALGGTAIAAKRYVITSTSQISPSVLKKLKGKRGPQGPRGAQGPAGSDGGSSAATSSPDFRFAAVAADGTLQNGVGVISVFGNAPGATRYVQFNRDVSQCYRAASISSGAGGQIRSSMDFDGSTVRVTTYSATGTDAFRDFQLIVACPAG